MVVLLVSLNAVNAESTPTETPAKMSDDELAVVGKLNVWREMFSATGRGERFEIDRYPQLFLSADRADRMLTFDQYVPEWAATQIDGVDGYRAVWNQDVNESFPGWTIEKLVVLDVQVDGDLAWSAVNYWGSGVRDGERYKGGQHGTHIWVDVDPGPNRDWRMRHEHLTAINVYGDGARIYDETPKPQPQQSSTK